VPILQRTLTGHNVIALLPTSKPLPYQLLTAQPGTLVVIRPLPCGIRSRTRDWDRRHDLVRCGVPAHERGHGADAAGYQFVFVSPERY
jgi:hypothetical protein